MYLNAGYLSMSANPWQAAGAPGGAPRAELLCSM
jgi:hypothetical protein